MNGVPGPGGRSVEVLLRRLGLRPDLSITWRSAGRGPSTPRSVGPSRSPRTSAASDRGWRSPGPATSRTPAASATSSTMSSTSCRRFSKSPASARPRRSMVSARSRSKASAWRTRSTRPTPTSRRTHHTQYFEMMGDHAIYHDGWIASTKVIRPPWEVVGAVNQDPVNNVTWELYDLSKDWTQADDVAAAHPDKVKELAKLFLAEARKYEVLPLDASVATRSGATAPQHYGGPVRIRLHGAADRHPAGRFAPAPQRLLHDHRGRRGAARRRRRHAADLGRPLRRLWLLPAEGQAGVPLEPPRSEAPSLGRAGRARSPASTPSSSTSPTTASVRRHWPSTT